MITLEALNGMPVSEFVAALAGVFEHSPWVGERTAPARPFASREHLLQTMLAIVAAASLAEQMALIRAHPELGAVGRRNAQLTKASAREQKRAGLEACSDEQFAELRRLNSAYAEKFGFPFILFVRGHEPRSIIATCQSRLHNAAEVERRTALAEIGMIAAQRLAELVG